MRIAFAGIRRDSFAHGNRRSLHARSHRGSPQRNPGRGHPHRLRAGARRKTDCRRTQQTRAGRRPRDPCRDRLPPQRGADRRLSRHDALFDADALLPLRGRGGPVRHQESHRGREPHFPRRAGVHARARRRSHRSRPAGMRRDDEPLHRREPQPLERRHREVNYQVFARKYRPRDFDSVVGQEHITRTLKNAIEQNRLAHAYLFVGPRGVGKTSTARILAKALNCVKGPTVMPCGECDSCREIARGTSLDVLEIDGASNNGVEQVRELRENVRFAPAHGKFKIYIIDEVHMLTTQAFNALLKTLEEPPAHVKFIFATTEPQKVLPTILSRCQRFDLRRIPANLIVKHLKEIAKKEKVVVDDEALAAIARGAEGGLRDAESTLDQLISFCGNKIEEGDVLSVFGLVAHDQIAALTDAIIDGQTTKALRVLKDLDEIGKDLQRLVADLLDHFRNLLVVTLGEEGVASLQLPDTEIELLKSQAKRTDADAALPI